MVWWLEKTCSRLNDGNKPMPPALLHQLTTGRFPANILKLTEHSILVIVTSSFCAPLPWHFDWPTVGPRPSVKVEDLIGDLAFENPRVVQGAKGGFMCSVPAQNSLDLSGKNKSGKHIHNHQTLSKRSHYLRKVWSWTGIWNHKISLSNFYDIWYFLRSFVDWLKNKFWNLILNLNSNS